MPDPVLDLQRLEPAHAGPVLDFERANRDYFAQFISDRGDEYFEQFAERHQWLLDDQAAGNGAYYVLVDDDGSILGRFNLLIRRDEPGTAVLGYRVAQRAAGCGVATTAVGRLCRLAADELGLRTILAATSTENVASTKVLRKAGFVAVGPAGPEDLGGKVGTWYRLDLIATPRGDR